MEYREILYEKKDGVARITINRPKVMNACNNVAVYELTQALMQAWSDDEVRVVVFTGAGDRAFCTGGDQSIRTIKGYENTIAALPLEVGWQQVTWLIRFIPKPVIARVNGYAIGGGHVWQVACDFGIASESARFGQAGPRVGSFDPGFGTGELMRNVGTKKAKEIWFLTRVYSAQEALQMGLVNAVVPPDKLDEEVDKWCEELLAKSSTSLKFLKYAFNAETDGVTGVTYLGIAGLGLYYNTEEAAEGVKAFQEKRKPRFEDYRKVAI